MRFCLNLVSLRHNFVIYIMKKIDIDMGRQWNIGGQLTYINSAPNNVTDNRSISRMKIMC